MEKILMDMPSFKDLDTNDKLACIESFRRAPSDRCLQHKYLKRTAEIIQRTKGFSSQRSFCFITFDVIEISDLFVVLAFMINGIFDNYRYVLYYNVMGSHNAETRVTAFILDIFENILFFDLPKLESLSVKFVLLKHSKWIDHAIDKLLMLTFNAKLLIAFTPCELKRLTRANKDIYNAISDIMIRKFTPDNVKGIFDNYKELFQNLISEDVHNFLTEFEIIAYELLVEKHEVIFANCTYERTKDFLKLLQLHFNAVKKWPPKLIRLFTFESIRAIITIFDY